jgi:hypothetical protein
MRLHGLKSTRFIPSDSSTPDTDVLVFADKSGKSAKPLKAQIKLFLVQIFFPLFENKRLPSPVLELPLPPSILEYFDCRIWV